MPDRKIMITFKYITVVVFLKQLLALFIFGLFLQLLQQFIRLGRKKIFFKSTFIEPIAIIFIITSLKIATESLISLILEKVNAQSYSRFCV